MTCLCGDPNCPVTDAGSPWGAFNASIALSADALRRIEGITAPDPDYAELPDDPHADGFNPKAYAALMHSKAEEQGRALGSAKVLGADATIKSHSDVAKMRELTRAARDPLGIKDEPPTPYFDARELDPYVLPSYSLAASPVTISAPPDVQRLIGLAQRTRKPGEPSLDVASMSLDQYLRVRVSFDADGQVVGWEAHVEARYAPWLSSFGLTAHTIVVDEPQGIAQSDPLPPPHPVCPRHGPTKGGLCRKCERRR